MNPETLQEIYRVFVEDMVNSSDLLYYLSRYDLAHEMTRDSFQKRTRVHRTIVTEIKRYSEQNGSFTDSEWASLRELYIKDYLYHCAANNFTHQDHSFTDYIQSLTETHAVIAEQYSHLDDMEAFWRAVSLMERDMQKT